MLSKDEETSDVSLDGDKVISKVPRGLSQNDNENLSFAAKANENLSVAAKSNETYYLDSRYRWYMVAFGAAAILFSGPVFMNWPKVEELLKKGDAYIELCNQGEKNCKAQELAVSALASFSISIMFSFTFVAGVVLDTLGSKICTMLGISSIIIGYVFLALSSATRNLYKVFIFFISAGADPALFGLLSISNLFPSRSSTIIAVFGMTRGVSFAVPLVMVAIWNGSTVTVRGIAIFYACVLVVWLSMVAYLLPFVPYPSLRPDAISTDKEFTPLLTRLQKRPQFSWEGFKTGTKTQIKEFLQYGLSWAYLALLPLPVFTLIRNSYYSMTFKNHLPNTIQLLSILNPLSVIPCPAFGYLADRLGASPVIFILSFSGAASILLVMFKGIVWEIISNLFNWVFMSFIASQFYVYVSSVYPQSQMGKLVGIALLFGGLVSMVSKQMFEAAELRHMYPLMDAIVVGMGCAGCVISAFLFIFVEKPVQRSRRAALSALKDEDKNVGDATKQSV